MAGQLQGIWGAKTILFLFLILILMFFNWFIEALKWKYLIHQIQRQSIPQSYNAVLRGIYLSLITPNRLGDGFARIEALKPKSRSNATYSFLVGSLSQTLAVSILGLMAIWASPYELIDNKYLWLTAKVIMTLLVLALALFYYSNNLREKLGDLVGKLWRTKSRVNYSAHQLNTVLAMSIGRYFVFAFQFYVALLIFGINLDFLTCQICIAMMYMLSTWIPSFLLGDLGIRESVAIFIFGEFTAFPEIAFFASLTIWIINLFLPSILGMFLFTFRKKKHV